MIVETATTEILSQGAMVIILSAGMILMYRHFIKEVKELKEVIKYKDEEIRVLNKEVSELLRQSTMAHAEMAQSMKALTEFIKGTWKGN